MDNKELPQEVVNEIEEIRKQRIRNYGYTGDWNNMYLDQIKAAKIAHSRNLKELQAKDTTIKEQAEKIEKLTGLLKEKVLECHVLKWGTIRAKGISRQDFEDNIIKKYKEQHGI